MIAAIKSLIKWIKYLFINKRSGENAPILNNDMIEKKLNWFEKYNISRPYRKVPAIH